MDELDTRKVHVAMELGQTIFNNTIKKLTDDRDRLQRQRDKLLVALKYMVEVTPEPPEANCRCHLAAPCNDCVEYSALREAFVNAHSAIAEVGEPT